MKTLEKYVEIEMTLRLTIEEDELVMKNINTEELRCYSDIPKDELKNWVINSCIEALCDGDVDYSDIDFV